MIKGRKLNCSKRNIIKKVEKIQRMHTLLWERTVKFENLRMFTHILIERG